MPQSFFRFRFVLLLLGLTCLLGESLYAQGSGKPNAANNRNRPGANRQQNKKPKKPTFNQTTEKTVKLMLDKPIEVDKLAIAVARKIDSLVEANYVKHQVRPNPPTTDEQFLRRIYLDITGTIPTYEQVEEFLDSDDPQKRGKLIQALLDSDGYVSHNFNYWADVLRVRDRLDNNLPGVPYREWIKDCLRENKPYNEMVREMLSAKGKIWNEPAAGYILIDDGMPLNNMANTVRIFLGTQIGCAQCHDHPFNEWTQKQFYEIAAFAAGSVTRGGGLNNPQARKAMQSLRKFEEQLRKSDMATYRAVRLLTRANRMEIRDFPGRKLKLPHDYAYSDGKPNQVVEPKVLFGEQPDLEGKNTREAFSQWLTASDNPRFARAIANRMWKKAMGIGLIEPIDDLEAQDPENPELLDFLTYAMVRYNFNLKHFMRAIYYTRTYQRQSTGVDLDPEKRYHYPGPLLRRMTAEQIWDSFLTLAVNDPDGYERSELSEFAEVIDLSPKDLSMETVREKAKRLKELNPNTIFNQEQRKYRYKGQALVRASELPSPAPENHFVRRFGQSDRELIEDSSKEGSSPQVMTMFNGPITHMLLEGGSVMYNNVIEKESANARLKVIFYSILNRRPSPDDRRLALEEIRKNGPAGYGNVIWALVNTREFMFIQ